MANIFDGLAERYMLPKQRDNTREAAAKVDGLNNKIVVSWKNLIAFGINGQCCLLAASWLAAEVGNWVIRKEFKKEYNRQDCVAALGNSESWVLGIIESWMRE